LICDHRRHDEPAFLARGDGEGVSNIFDKLGVSSRAGATAWAYRHNLI
jgi:hypothetical protein